MSTDSREALPTAAATADSRTPDSAIPMMAQVYARLRNRLRLVEAQLAEQLGHADNGDDNTEDRVTQRQVTEAQANSLRAIVERAVVVPISGRAIVGSIVFVRTAEEAPLERYEIVLPTESEPAEKKVAFDSPIGSALLGKEVGDVAVVQTPRGRRELSVMVIKHE